MLLMHWKNTEAVKFLIKFYPMRDFTQDLSSSINCQSDKHKAEVTPPLNPYVVRRRGLIYRQKTQETIGSLESCFIYFQ